MAYFHANVPGLHYPLMALIHYCGFVLVAESVLPINKSTLMYGSDDAGITIHNDDEELNFLMKTAAYRLKLTERAVTRGPESNPTRAMIAGPVDIGAFS